MASRYHRQPEQSDPMSSMFEGYPNDHSGLSFAIADPSWDPSCWTYQTVIGGTQDFQSFQTTDGLSYGQASKTGAGVHPRNFSNQEIEEFMPSNQWISNHNSPAYSVADVASLQSEVSLELQSNYVSSLSNRSPSVPDMDTYSVGEFDGAFNNNHGYPMNTGVDSPSGFSIAMSRDNSMLSNPQQYQNSPPSYSPLFEDVSVAHTQNCSTSVTGKAGRRRNQPDSSNAARRDPLYHNAVVGPDGLYHCPWENVDPKCNHKPEKLKCNYDKCIDSHLKPYKCKITACADARFSSTACLLRHEREAHAMHGHGEKPFSCELDTCERSVPGHGFPRHWNLCDHMTRVHGLKAKTLNPEKTTKGTRKRKVTTVDTANKKSRASKSPKKEATSPVMSASAREAHFVQEQKRLAMEAMEQVDPHDPMAMQKLAQISMCFRT